MFYIAQFFGLLGLIILIISFQKNNKSNLLKYQIISSLLFSIQYLCLNAITGCLMNFMTMIRNIIYKKYKDNVSILVLILIILGMIILSMFSYKGIISLLPTIAVILYSIALYQKKMTIIRITEVISCCLFIIYNIKVLALTGLITTILETIFSLVAIYKFDIKKIK